MQPTAVHLLVNEINQSCVLSLKTTYNVWTKVKNLDLFWSFWTLCSSWLLFPCWPWVGPILYGGCFGAVEDLEMQKWIFWLAVTPRSPLLHQFLRYSAFVLHFFAQKYFPVIYISVPLLQGCSTQCCSHHQKINCAHFSLNWSSVWTWKRPNDSL